MTAIVDILRNVFSLLLGWKDTHPPDKRICIAALLNVLMNVLVK
jgi:hypothetical protein